MMVLAVGKNSAAGKIREHVMQNKNDEESNQTPLEIKLGDILKKLDEYDRNDSIYITRNKDGIELQSLTEKLNRNDIKRSDAYQSGLLEGTTPAYEAFMQLKNSISAYV